MKDDSRLKLIAITGINQLRLYVAKDMKIIEQLGEIDLNVDKHHRGDKKQSHFHKKSGPSSLFEPHTAARDIEHEESARGIAAELEKLTSKNKYREIIIAAEPRMLGFIRQQLSAHVKKLQPTEIHKDLLHYNKSQLEEIIFAK